MKYLRARKDLFARTVDAKGMKTKVSKETITAFSTMIEKRIVPGIFGLTSGRDCWRV